MKCLSVTIILVVLFISGVANARTEAEIKKDLNKATKTAAKIYKKNGMFGLIGETQECYANSKFTSFYCVYFDLASRHIDQVMIEDAAQNGMAFPKTEFFDDESFGERVAKVFKNANMDMNTSNVYLQKVTPVVNKMVEDTLFKIK